MSKTVGIVGARGHVGRELIALLQPHPGFEIAFVSSRQLAGQAVAGTDIGYESLDAAEVARRGADICVMALPNGVCAPFVDALGDNSIVVDLSGDNRFDDAWVYGLPELNRETLPGAARISNPGCYATAMQFAIWPAREALTAPPVCFGVSGYSGAGTTPSRKNDTDVLADNLLPYALTGHLHEREVSRQLQRQVYFTPHVASFFRGISMTVVMQTGTNRSAGDWHEHYRAAYGHETLVRIEADIPEVKTAAGRHGVQVGGFGADGNGRLVVIATLDNLLKGAATQALQNMNLVCGYDELEGIPHG